MVLKKSDLYSSLWKSCDELRGGMDASQYKDYILTLLFVKYVADKAKSDPNSLIEVPKGGSFEDMLALKGDKEIGDKINKVISTEAVNLYEAPASGNYWAASCVPGWLIQATVGSAGGWGGLRTNRSG